jgi:hypothetical protein
VVEGARVGGRGVTDVEGLPSGSWVATKEDQELGEISEALIKLYSNPKFNLLKEPFFLLV